MREGERKRWKLSVCIEGEGCLWGACVFIITEAPFQSAEPEFQPKLWVSDDHHNDSYCLFALHGKACDTSAAVLKLALS